MKFAIVFLTLITATTAIADETVAPSDPEITLRASEIQALVNLGIEQAEYQKAQNAMSSALQAAASAQAKVRAAIQPKPQTSPSTPAK